MDFLAKGSRAAHPPVCLGYYSVMDTIKKYDTGAAVEDVQLRLAAIGLLDPSEADGEFGEETAVAFRAFCRSAGLPVTDEIDEKAWSALVDASFQLGDRTLYLRMPYFHGQDVKDLQRALAILGFDCGNIDGIFGAHTEDALRKFQLNLALPTDGIAGAYTFEAIRNLRHSWEDREVVSGLGGVGFARAADVLESNALCVFGTTDFTRSVASRISNLSLATNPTSTILSADSLLVTPDERMLKVQIVLPDQPTPEGMPRVSYEEGGSLARRLRSAIARADEYAGSRLAVELPGTMWADAGEERTAQHFAITLLDAFCAALG